MGFICSIFVRRVDFLHDYAGFYFRFDFACLWKRFVNSQRKKWGCQAHSADISRVCLSICARRFPKGDRKALWWGDGAKPHIPKCLDICFLKYLVSLTALFFALRVDKAFSQARKNESKAKSCIIMQKVNPSDEKEADKTHKMNDWTLKMRKTT